MRQIIENIEKKINEASYRGNLGFVEMVKFYDVATEQQKNRLMNYLEKKQNDKAWKLLQMVTRTKLYKEERELWKRVDRQGFLVQNQKGDVMIAKGKHAGEYLFDLHAYDSSVGNVSASHARKIKNYVMWMIQNNIIPEHMIDKVRKAYNI